MEKTQLTVAELSSLLRMIQVIPDADSPGRIHQMLLAFCTAWRTIGMRRAFLFLVDERGRMVRGHLASTQTPDEAEPPATFEALARRVVDSTQRIETSDLTLRARTFSVPLDWQRCALVKAATTGLPVLADRRTSEFSTDPYFDFFQAQAYVTIPLRVNGRVTAVLAADHCEEAATIGIEDISLIYSMAQQAATAIERLQEAGDNTRKFRVLRKLQDVLAASENPRRFGDSLSAMLSMVSRAMGGSGALLKDLTRKKTTHVKSVDELDEGDRDADIALTDSFDDILERVSGTVKPLRGDAGHALFSEAASQVVRCFIALPLVAGGECLGALAVYSDVRSTMEGDEFSGRDRLFLELCAGMLAERLDSLYKVDQLERSGRMLDEVQSNLVRERAASRIGTRSQEQYQNLIKALVSLREVLGGRQTYERRMERARRAIEAIEAEATEFQNEIAEIKSSLALVDLFALVQQVADEWAPDARKAGVEVTLRIPSNGPVLLMDRDSIGVALHNILRVLGDHVARGDRVLIECSAGGGKAVIVVADTAGNLDGTLLSRLFMPFTRGDDAESHAAMAAAGDILQRHAGEITVKSSPSWRTILGIAFPASANTDRRRTRRDRRHHDVDRRTAG